MTPSPPEPARSAGGTATGARGAAHQSVSTAPGGSRFSALLAAAALSLGIGIALGLARFSYALLLPPMKADLGWSFAQAGSMNTVNAGGYLIGALVCPWILRRCKTASVFSWGCVLTAVLMGVPALLSSDAALLAQRLCSGIGSAMIVVGGGMLAARLATRHPADGGLLLGIYYGGAGWGVMLSAVLVPVALLRAHAHGWQSAWLALALGCAVFAAIAIRAARVIEPGAAGVVAAASSRAPAAAPSAARVGAPAHAYAWRRYGWALAAYGLFGVGYIGYMTFVIALLRNAGMSATVITAFYGLLGAAVVASARLWAGLLDRVRGGGALALLNLLLGVATLLPALFTQPAVAFISGALFGATFLSLVTSTTAFVRHNLPPAHWAAGISAFTVVFALGQIVGPVVIGHISDGSGLALGFVYSGAVLFAGALLAILQRPLQRNA